MYCLEIVKATYDKVLGSQPMNRHGYLFEFCSFVYQVIFVSYYKGNCLLLKYALGH